MRTLFGNELLNEFVKLLSSAKQRIWICSPYVGSLSFIEKYSDGRIFNKRIDKRFITDINEVSKLNSSFFKHIIKSGELRTLSGVHAKIYIVDNKVLITSANLTKTAFTKRYEIGLLLERDESIESINIFETFWRKSIPVKKINSPNPSSTSSSRKKDESFGSSLPKIWGINKQIKQPQFWLKPIGDSDNPVTEKRTFKNSTDELHFSANPSGIKINDILIAYGIGAKRILTVYKVTTLGAKFKKEDITEDWMNRWSYYLNADNLTPYFGKIWMKKNLYANDLVDEFLKNNPDELITLRSKGLGAIQWKKDKIRLNPNFAGFIINKIEQ